MTARQFSINAHTDTAAMTEPESAASKSGFRWKWLLYIGAACRSGKRAFRGLSVGECPFQVLRAFRFYLFQYLFDLRVLRLRDSVHGDVVDLVFPYENKRVTDAIRFFDGVGNGFHQAVFLLLRETWRGINVNYRHNSFLGFRLLFSDTSWNRQLIRITWYR